MSIKCLARYLVLGVATLASLASLVPLIPTNIWWIRVGDFPRVQLLVLLAGCAAGLLPWVRRTSSLIVLVLVAASIVVQLYWIHPFFPGSEIESQPATLDDPKARIRIFCLNILQENKDSNRLLQQIEKEQPDVLALFEVNDRWIDELAALKEHFDWSIEHPQDNTYGLAIYGRRVELVEGRVRHRVEPEIPSVDVRIRLESGTEALVVGIHPRPPRFGTSSTNRDAELVIVAQEAMGPTPTIVLGDMNDVGWSRTTRRFREISGLLDPRRGRGLYSTFFAGSSILKFPLDHVFHSAEFRLVEMTVLGDVGSDHFPLLVELSFEPSLSEEQVKPEPDAETLRDGLESIEEAQGNDEGSTSDS